MTYAFNLKWNELSDELREEKITEYIEMDAGMECEDCGGAGINPQEATCKSCGGKGSIPANSDNQQVRDEAEDSIKAHFPIYF